MLEGISQIGRTYRESTLGGFVFSLVNRAPEGRDGEKKHLLAMNFCVAEDCIELSFPELSDKVCEEYLWVGNCKGNIPQDRLTTDQFKYLLFDTLPNLSSKLEDGEFKKVVAEVVGKFFTEAEVGKGKLRFLDVRKIKGFPAEVELPQVEDVKKFQREYVKLFFQLLKEHYGFSEKDFNLFSAMIEGRRPSEIEGYITYLERSMVEEQFKDSFEGTCYVCGKKEYLTWDTKRLPNKFYITNLITFSSELSGEKKNAGFARNFVLCQECYRNLISGMRYLRNYLSANLARNTLYIIPGLFFNPVGKVLTENWMDLSRRFVVSTFTLDNFLKFKEEIEQELERYREFEELIDYGYVDLLFYRSEQSFFKIKRLIREVPLRRVKEIQEVIQEIKALGDRLLGENRDWLLSLNGMYYLLPVRSGKEVEHRKILDVYEHLFLGYPLDRGFLMRFFLTLAQVYHFERPDYNVSPGNNPELGLIRAILQTQLLLKFFEKLSLIKGGGKKVVTGLEILDENITQYVQKMGYSEEETALFLLGYLIGEIGAKQLQGSSSSKKPILNKINFNGMNARNILTLSNEVFEKLDQYQIRKYNERIFAFMKSLLDAHIKNWSLSEVENVYYILSGYAFCTYQMLTRGKKKEEEGEEQ